MILDTVAVKFNSPEYIFDNPTYPSGLYSEQNTIFTYGYKERDYPLLTLPQPIYDNSGNFISDGYYIVALSDDKKFLYIIQGNILKAKIPVAKYEELAPNQEDIDDEKEIKNNLEKARNKNNRKKIKIFEQELEKFNRRILNKMTATLEDSGEGYYILKYSRLTQKAWAFIAK